MTQVSWSSNSPEGRGLRRAFRRLQGKLQDTNNLHDLCELVRAMGYVAQIKAGIAKTEDLEKRISELERIAGIAQKTKPISQ